MNISSLTASGSRLPIAAGEGWTAKVTTEEALTASEAARDNQYTGLTASGAVKRPSPSAKNDELDAAEKVAPDARASSDMDAAGAPPLTAKDGREADAAEKPSPTASGSTQVDPTVQRRLDALKEASGKVEAMLIKEMVAKMRASVPKTAGSTNMAQISEEMMDTAVAESIGKQANMGIAQAIYRQLAKTVTDQAAKTALEARG